MAPIGVSFHVFPHMMSNGPLPALGYIKAYAESRMESLEVRPVYWSTLCIRIFKNLQLLGSDSSSIEGNIRAQNLFDDLFVAMALMDGETQDTEKLQEILHSCQLILEPTKQLGQFETQPKDFLEKLLKWMVSKANELNCLQDDIIACSFGSIQSLQALSFLSVMRKKIPKAWFVVGGLTEQQARLLMDAAPFVDIAVFGEGEQSFLELCKAKENSMPLELINGIAYRRENAVIVNQARDCIGDISGHWADYSGFDWDFAAEGGSDVDLPIWDSRNCWWGRCEFCDFMRTQRTFAERDAEDIKAEIDQHIRRHPETTRIKTRLMLLGLEACGSDKNRFVQILDDLIELKRNRVPEMRSFFELSPRNSDRRMMKRLNELNPLIQWGFEQVNKTLEICNKSHRIETVIDTLKLAMRFQNVKIAGFNLMISVPGDSYENCLEMRENLWLLRFIFAGLFRQEQMLLFRPLQIDVCDGIAFGELIDFTSPEVRENLRRTPWVNRYSHVIGDEEKAIDFGTTIQLTQLPDDSVTRDRYLSVINKFSERVDVHSIRVNENRDEELVLAMDEGGLSVDVRLTEDERTVLAQTAAPTRFRDIEGFDGDDDPEIAGVLRSLGGNGLMWFDQKRHVCINTLPPEAQDFIDLFELRVRSV